VATGSILGTGIGKPGAHVRWAVAGRMVIAWCITMPAAGLSAAVMWYIGDLFNGIVGGLVMEAILVAACGWMWVRSRLAPVSADNVNDEWQEAPARQRTRV